MSASSMENDSLHPYRRQQPFGVTSWIYNDRFMMIFMLYSYPLKNPNSSFRLTIHLRFLTTMSSSTPKPPPTASTPKKRPEYPDPLIIPSLKDHKQTFIILHGRGSNAATFGPPFLDTQIPKTQTFRSAFPNAQFIFPTASKRRAQIYHRSLITQWFDNWSLTTPNEKTELQVQGLRESSAYIHSLLRNAIELVGAQNVVLGGLSQGCAAAMVALLMWDGEPIKAGFGMCGWLPFRKEMEDVLDDCGCGGAGKEGGGEAEVCESGEEVDGDAPTQAVAFLKEELEMRGDGRGMVFRRIPLFLGHGVEDVKVPVGLGREAVRCLGRLGARVEWREYEGLGHWYSEAMLGDLVKILKVMTRWEDPQRNEEE